MLVNLVCPPPSISNKPPLPTQGQQSLAQNSNGPTVEIRERNAERNTERTVPPSQNELRERNADISGVERGSAAVFSTTSSNASQTATPIVTSGLVGDRRISLGAGSGCAGLAAQLEQGYHQAREAVRANNGIKVLLQLLQPRVVTPPGALDCLRALACRVLLGLSRDDTIAHILTRLQVNDKLYLFCRSSIAEEMWKPQMCKSKYLKVVQKYRSLAEMVKLKTEILFYMLWSNYLLEVVMCWVSGPTSALIE